MLAVIEDRASSDVLRRFTRAREPLYYFGSFNIEPNGCQMANHQKSSGSEDSDDQRTASPRIPRARLFKAYLKP